MRETPPKAQGRKPRVGPTPSARLAREAGRQGGLGLGFRFRFRFRLAGRLGDLALERRGVGQPPELVDEHQRVLRRDLEPFPARLARHLVVEPEEVAPRASRTSRGRPRRLRTAAGPSWRAGPTGSGSRRFAGTWGTGTGPAWFPVFPKRTRARRRPCAYVSIRPRRETLPVNRRDFIARDRPGRRRARGYPVARGLAGRRARAEEGRPLQAQVRAEPRPVQESGGPRHRRPDPVHRRPGFHGDSSTTASWAGRRPIRT